MLNVCRGLSPKSVLQKDQKLQMNHEAEEDSSQGMLECMLKRAMHQRVEASKQGLNFT